MYDGFKEMEEERNKLTGFILVIEPKNKESIFSKIKKRFDEMAKELDL